jgi:hypothetical protein
VAAVAAAVVAVGCYSSIDSSSSRWQYRVHTLMRTIVCRAAPAAHVVTVRSTHERRALCTYKREPVMAHRL